MSESADSERLSWRGLSSGSGAGKGIVLGALDIEGPPAYENEMEIPAPNFVVPISACAFPGDCNDSNPARPKSIGNTLNTQDFGKYVRVPRFFGSGLSEVLTLPDWAECAPPSAASSAG